MNARNGLELVEARGEGLFGNFENYAVSADMVLLNIIIIKVIAQYDDKYICEGHIAELSTDWDNAAKYNHYFRNSAKQPTCSHPKHVGKRSSVRKILSPSSSVTLEESKATLRYEGFLLHVGTR